MSSRLVLTSWIEEKHGLTRLFTWVLVEGCSLSYHNKETILLTIDPYCGNIN